MKKSEVLVKVQNYKKALKKLEEAVEIARDGVIQRFEFTVELLWKALKAVLAYHGINCFSPRHCIKEAFKANIIDDNEIILDMIEDRNLTSHIYDEATSEEVFQRIKQVYINYFRKLDLENKL